jgi:hypothetical protein
MEYLKIGNTEGWTATPDGKGIKCSRNGICSWKPLDCSLYPFFPTEVRGDLEFGYVVTLLAGFPKCSLTAEVQDAFPQNKISLSRTIPIKSEESISSVREHAFRAACVGIYLHEQGLAGWMRETAAGFKGYEGQYVVDVPAQRYNRALALCYPVNPLYL